MASRIRAKNHPTNNIGKVRQDLYKKAIERWQEAFHLGFYLECIAITDSMISDRMEARRAFLSGEEEFFTGTAPTIKYTASELTKEETQREDQIIKIINDIIEWSEDRNRAVHRLVKVATDNSEILFEERIEDHKKTAEKGFLLYRSLDSAVTRLNKYRADIKSAPKK